MGDLFNSINQEVLEHSIISKELFDGLCHNKVNLQDDCTTWKKMEMLRKLTAIMGLSTTEDPDDSYALTMDNVIKIIAIQMRFQ